MLMIYAPESTGSSQITRAYLNSGVPSSLISCPKEEAIAEPLSIYHWQCNPVQVLKEAV